MIFLTCLIAAYAVFLAATAALTAAAPFQGWLTARLGRRVGLGVPVDLDARLRERVRRRALGGSVGGLVGLAVALAACAAASLSGLFPWPSVASGYSVWMVETYGVLAVSAIATGLGVGWAALRAETLPADEPRVARTRAVGVRDYVPSVLRVGGWHLLGLAVATIVVIAVTGGVSPWLLPGAAVVAAGIGGMVTFEVVARRIVSRGRPASGTDEMVWNDALRSEALRDLLYAPLLAVVLGAWWSLIGQGDALRAPLALIPGALGLGGMVLFGFIFRHTRTWYLEELWPGSRRRTPDEEARRIMAVQAR
ncbi:hypothetical protein GCM10025867_14860 [Frondihabitans sucicola]|uniref:Uncharacterized protein n=1 Tax=Frondihabitans sucicola TaxID=1268041 RepID=A0ABM8GLK3_9MICO|nr:hypothetical protein [Frondihabitans sucicola]BDZ49245.1 hypothetical protein GCM10025867_14860 [Frondihabitans sucicola]